ncbi:TraR/DksA family transcriptional regulator [Variovorax dokdonensis]|uniref:TraR/DksA family transcriptional regulator n=1 Tax=Variovorax dokdonensis TaxID=344883 RepID=A0ABT7NAU8_9BURK|nr:TraR/DksA family transcriptional regulator [Variovorax dokdonensis]MDM0045071.1 TraR/DksA family transcriptional regulator [Variovorax dokdonensis]
MKHLSGADRISISQQLESMRLHALAELNDAAQVAANPPDSTQEVHTNADDAEAEREDEVRLAERAVDRQRLDDIERAQQRLSEGRYGICVDCGQDIPAARLFAQPIAIRCASCQARHEELPHRR